MEPPPGAAAKLGSSRAAVTGDQVKCMEVADENQRYRLSNEKENSKLRHVEKDVLIPVIMRDRAKELCSDKVQGNCGKCIGSVGNKAVLQVFVSQLPLKSPDQHVLRLSFTKCCKETGFLMVVKCRKENTALKDCLVGYYSDPSFYEECKTEYLKQREEYRATGIKKKKQKITSNI